MIYQMTIYYGAVVNGEAIYSIQTSLEDCKEFPENIDEIIFKYPLEQLIIKDGLKVSDFEFRYLTKEEYDNRYDKENEKVTTKTHLFDNKIK